MQAFTLEFSNQLLRGYIYVCRFFEARDRRIIARLIWSRVRASNCSGLYCLVLLFLCEDFSSSLIGLQLNDPSLHA